MNNGVFINGGDELSAYLSNPNPALTVRPAEYWEDEFLASLGKPDVIVGDETPWDGLSDKFRLREGEFTVWGGENNSGKSYITSQVALCLAGQGKKSLIASFEMTPKETLQRMACQYFSVAEYSKLTTEQGKEFLRFAKGRIWIYNQMGRVNTQIMFAIVRWARATLSIDHIFIDSLTMLVSGADNYSGQKETCHELASLAKDLGLHVHLVAHTKKPADGQKYNKFSISGTADISNLADNVIILNNMMNEDGGKAAGEPDIWMRVAKQRHGKFKGSTALHMRNEMYCFSDNAFTRYVKFGCQQAALGNSY